MKATLGKTADDSSGVQFFPRMSDLANFKAIETSVKGFNVISYSNFFIM